MTADVSGAREAVERGGRVSEAYYAAAGASPGVGEAVRLPAAGDRHGRGFDLAEVDSLPAGSALRRPY